MELLYHNSMTLKIQIKNARKSAKDGSQIYDPDFNMERSKSFRIENAYAKDLNKKQLFSVDGEIFEFQKFIKFECLHEELERLVDFDDMIKNMNWFPSN